MRPRRQRGHKRLHRDKALRPTNLPSLSGDGHDPAFTRKALVSRQNTRERACDGKARFSQYHHAEKARTDIAARYHDGQQHEIYACPFCGGFHLTRIA